MSRQRRNSNIPEPHWTPQEALEQTDRLELKCQRLGLAFWLLFFCAVPIVILEVYFMVFRYANSRVTTSEWATIGLIFVWGLALLSLGWIFHRTTVRQGTVRDHIIALQLPPSPPPFTGERFRWARVLERSPTILHVEMVPHSNIVGPLRFAGMIGLVLLFVGMVWLILSGKPIRSYSYGTGKGLGAIPFAVMALWRPFVLRWRAERSAGQPPRLVIESTRWFVWRSVTVLAGADLNRIEVQWAPQDSRRVCVVSKTGREMKEITLMRLPKQEPADWHCRRMAQSLRLILGLPARGV